MSDNSSAPESLRDKLHSLSQLAVYSRISDLEIGKIYNVVEFNLTSTRYGERLCANLELTSTTFVRVILPTRFQNLQTDIEQLNSSLRNGQKATLTYFGPLGVTNDIKLEIL